MNNYYVDTHCHLQDAKYKEADIKKIIENAISNNVQKIIISGYDEESNLKAVELAERYNSVYATVGYQPLELDHVNDYDLIELEKLISNPKVVAVGEIGLDYHYDNTNKKLQQKIFIKQIDLANKYKKPIVVHSRDCIEDTYEVINKYKNKDLKGVIHCYSGSYESSQKFSKLNLYFGVGGTLTYKNNVKSREVFSKIDLEKIILETDAPYLSPEPKRGLINEPANIPLIGKKLAEIRKISEKEIMNQTTYNAALLFDIK